MAGWSWEDWSTCFKCGVEPAPDPGTLCDGCARENPDHVKNDYFQTWSSERRQGFINDPVKYGVW